MSCTCISICELLGARNRPRVVVKIVWIPAKSNPLRDEQLTSSLHFEGPSQYFSQGDVPLLVGTLQRRLSGLLRFNGSAE